MAGKFRGMFTPAMHVSRVFFHRHNDWQFRGEYRLRFIFTAAYTQFAIRKR